MHRNCSQSTRFYLPSLLPLATALAGVLLLGAVPNGTTTMAVAAEPAPVSSTVTEQSFQAHLAAGEIGIARDIALQTNDQQQRERRILDVARRQLAAQAREGAWNTLQHLSKGSVAQQRGLSDSLAQLKNPQGARSQPDAGQPGGDLRGGRGGAALADFDTLINLIESTVSPDNWETNGGNGAIEPYPAGVYVDSAGVLKRSERIDSGTLERMRSRVLAGLDANGELSDESPLRLISLRKLQDAVSRRYLTGEPLSEEMKYLGGLHRAQFVFVDHQNSDILIGGPAGRLSVGESGRVLHTASGEAALQLDDLLVMLRTIGNGTPFGCTIEPRRENLAKLQSFLASQGPLKPGSRGAWLKGIQDSVGYQDVRVFGMSGETHAAQVLVEADYHMKRIGIGLEPTVDGVTSYISAIQLDENGNPPPMSVFRCWFVMNYDSVTHTKGKDAFELAGNGVRLLTENEMLTAKGHRVAKGRAEAFNREFAESFTEHYSRVAERYPVYGELRNVFDLALIATLMHEHGLEATSGLDLSRLRDPSIATVQAVAVPKEVYSVANLRVINKRHVIALVSGGVSVDARQTAMRKIQLAEEDKARLLTRQQQVAADAAADHWWWDVR